MTSQCNGCSLEHMADRIQELKAENASLQMFRPARRAEKNTEPVRQINQTDWAAWGMEKPDNEGWTPYKESITE